MIKLSQIGIRNKIKQNPYYRFQSLSEVAIAVELGITIDVNQATIDDWLRLPGFSIHQARSLVDLVNMGVQLFCIEDVAAASGVPLQRLQPYESILAFAYYDRLSSLSLEKINLNTAEVADILTVNSLNPDIAEEIVENRQLNGKYRNLIDLQRRLNLDRELISQLMHYVQF